MDEIVLYSTPTSSAAQRVRIALNLKGMAYTERELDLAAPGEEYVSLNPQGLVPTLLDGYRVFPQSLSIIEYLDDVYPEPRILPVDDRDRARVRALSNLITSDIHPLNTSRVTKYLGEVFDADATAIRVWKQQWITEGFKALEAAVADHPASGMFCQGDSVSMADICLVPQVNLAMREEVDMSPFTAVQRIYEECMWLDAFKQAIPK